MKVMVLGGAGFIGRHAVSALLGRGHDAIVGSRNPRRASRRLSEAAQDCEFRQLRFEQLPDAGQWQPSLEGIEAVINCVGILRERHGETYETVHVHAPVALAQACKDKGICLVHVSALGLNHPHRSRFLRSKLQAERLIRASGADYRLVRPSLLDGRGGYGAKWIRRLSALPIHVLPNRAVGKIAALDVEDLGEALARLIELPIAADAPVEQREFDLGGLHQRDLARHMQAIRLSRAGRAAICVRVPAWMARVASHLCDLMHFSPFSFGHWELLQQDNVPGHNRLPELLGRAPRPIGAALGAPATIDRDRALLGTSRY
jgi:NADH dehydrogenase